MYNSMIYSNTPFHSVVAVVKYPSTFQTHCDAVTNSSDQMEPVCDILLDGSLIQRMALRSSGSARPSSNSFRGSSNLLFDALASFARRLASECVDPKRVAPYLLVT